MNGHDSTINKLKVLHIYKSFYPDSFGGVEECIYQLCKSGPEYGFDSDVFTLSSNPSEGGSIIYNGIKVYQAKTNGALASTPFSFEAFGKLSKIKDNYDILHFHYPYPFADLLRLFLARRNAAVLTYHSDIVKQKYLKYLYFPIEKWFLNSFDNIVCTSPTYMATSKNLQRYHNKVECVLLGITENKNEFNLKPNLKFFEFKGRIPYILFLGGLRNYKGIDKLIDAAEHCRVNIIIAGSGPKLPHYQDLVRKKGLKNVCFTGYLDDVDKSLFLENCLALILPSTLRSEAFGLVLLEAA